MPRAYVKGASNGSWTCATSMLTDDGVEAPMDQRGNPRRGGAPRSAGPARPGLRLRADLPAETSELEGSPPSDLRFLGLQAMQDPPRAEAISAVARCREAGIEVKMMTGDHAVTAAAVAAEFGLERGAMGGRERGHGP